MAKGSAAKGGKTEVRKVVSPVFRVSFPHVFEAQSYDGGEPKFGVSAVWTPSKFSPKDKERWKAMIGLLDEAAQAGFKKAFKDLPANVKRGLRNGAEKADLEGYGEGTRFANLTSKMRPGVVDSDGTTKIGPEEGNADKIYPGCYARATVTAYFYNNKGKGVALGLNNLQFVKDGERLDSRTDASEDFAEAADDAWLDAEADDSAEDTGDEADDI